MTDRVTPQPEPEVPPSVHEEPPQNVVPPPPSPEAAAEAFDAGSLDERSIASVATTTTSQKAAGIAAMVAAAIVCMWLVLMRGEQSIARITDPNEEEFDSVGSTEVMEEAPIEDFVAVASDPLGTEFNPDIWRMAEEKAREQRARRAERERSPLMLEDDGGSGRLERGGSVSKGSEIGPGGSASDWLAQLGVQQAPEVSEAQGEDLTPEEAFASRVSSGSVETVYATRIRSGSAMITQGTLVRGVLETAIQSDLPGFIRAQVAHDVYSFDGSRRLIPRGSRLIGQYKSGLERGQARLFVIWTRVLRPDGVSIELGSPGTDLLGRAGLTGDLDTHFWKIFGASTLLSVVDGAIDVAVERARRRGGDGGDGYRDVGSDTSDTAAIALEDSINIPPTIYVDQGTPIQVFVARDLDFGSVVPAGRLGR